MSDNFASSLSSIALQLLSNKEIYIENYRKLVLYTNCEIIVDSKDCRVRILGNSLFMSFYSKYEMIITGNICEVSFLR